MKPQKIAAIVALIAVLVGVLAFSQGSTVVAAAEENPPEFDGVPPGLEGNPAPGGPNGGLREHLLNIAGVLGGREAVEELLETYTPRDLVAVAAVGRGGSIPWHRRKGL